MTATQNQDGSATASLQRENLGARGDDPRSGPRSGDRVDVPIQGKHAEDELITDQTCPHRGGCSKARHHPLASSPETHVQHVDGARRRRPDRTPISDRSRVGGNDRAIHGGSQMQTSMKLLRKPSA